MARMRHGETVSLNEVRDARNQAVSINQDLGLAAAPFRIYETSPYDYMFKGLQADDEAMLPSTNKTIAGLEELAASMALDSKQEFPESTIPSAYTYFGQFVDHDISLELKSDGLADLDNSDLQPLTLFQIRENLQNRRSPTLDLDSVYGITSEGEPVLRTCDKLAVGSNCYAEQAPMFPGKRPPKKDINNDLPRKAPDPNNRIDREAIIGDARNDENLIISQLHVTFLRAHNTLVSRGLTFNQARKVLTEHYQWLIIHEFLAKVIDPEIRDEIVTYGNRYFRPRPCQLFMPLEFSAAAYRFGHSMVRREYDYNENFQTASLIELMSVPSFHGLPPTVDRLPEQWIIEWKNFLDGGKNVAKQINTTMVDPLADLRDKDGTPLKGIKRNLAHRNLIRGYLLRIPIGQKVALACGFTPLTPEEILERSQESQRAIVKHFGFHEKTPLWYYVLTEAAGRNSLGPVGSTIVGETLVGLIRWTEDSILTRQNWQPSLGSVPRQFSLKDLFALAGLWN